MVGKRAWERGEGYPIEIEIWITYSIVSCFGSFDLDKTFYGKNRFLYYYTESQYAAVSTMLRCFY
jgi:hypothetical protein